MTHDYMIQCPDCGHVNDMGYDGCTACGKTLVPWCPKCRKNCGPDDSFCGSCGTATEHRA